MRDERERGSAGRREKSAPVPAEFSIRHGRLTLALILALAAFLRFYQITTIPPALHFDEAMNGNDAMENLETGHMDVFYPQNGGREGLYIDIETVLIRFLGNEAWVLRLPAAAFGVLTVAGVYLLAAELFSAPVGLAAAFFLATSFWHLLFSRIGLRAIGSPLFLAWAAYLMLNGARRARAGRPYLGRMLLAGVVYGLGFYTYIAYRASPVVIAVAALGAFLEAPKGGPRRALWRPLAVFALAAVATVTPLAVYFARHPGSLLRRSSEVSIFNGPRPFAALMLNIWKTTLMIFYRGDADWLHNISFRPMVFWPVAILFALGAGLGLRAVWRGVRRGQGEAWFGYAVALTWLASAAAPAVLSTENMPHALRSLLMVPAVFLLAAAGAGYALTRLAARVRPSWLRAASWVLAAVLCYEPYHSYFDVWARNPKVAEAFNIAGADIASRINALPKTAPKYVVAVAPGLPIGMPAPAQTIMFLTASYTRRQQEETNIHYIIRKQGDPDGLEFCRQAAASLQGNVFCLQVNSVGLPSF